MNYYISNIKLKSDAWYMNTCLSRFQEGAIFRKTTVVSFGRSLCFNRTSGAMGSKVLNQLTCTKRSTTSSWNRAQEDAFAIKQFVIPQLQRTNYIRWYNKLYSWIWEHMGFFLSLYDDVSKLPQTDKSSWGWTQWPLWVPSNWGYSMIPWVLWAQA